MYVVIMRCRGRAAAVVVVVVLLREGLHSVEACEGVGW